MRQISKIKQYDAIDEEYVRRRVRISQKKNQVTECARGKKHRKKRDADDDKRALMTINEREQSSHTPLYGISPIRRGFAPTLRTTC